MYDVIIIGAGPGGMSAAVYASRAKLKTLIIEGGLPGGQMNNTETLDNYLGTPKAKAPALAEEMYDHALSFGAEEAFGFVTQIEKNGRIFTVQTKKKSYQARAVILATGTQYKKLEVLSAPLFEGQGVSYCAVCDAPFYQDKEVAVIGGGDSALEEALYLTQFASKVHLIHRRDTYRGQPLLVEEVKQNTKIEEHLNTVVSNAVGGDYLNGLTLLDVKTEKKTNLSVSGAFVYIGQLPQTNLLKPFNLLTQEGHVYDFDPETMMTSIAGLFTVGDIIDKPIRQVANAVGEGALAGQSVYTYLKQLEKEAAPL